MAGKGLNQNIYKSFSLAYCQRINKAIIMWPELKTFPFTRVISCWQACLFTPNVYSTSLYECFKV